MAVNTLLLAMLITGTQTSIASEKGKSELGVVYGVLTSNELIDTFADELVYPVTLGAVTTSHEDYSEAFYFGYRYALTNK